MRVWIARDDIIWSDGERYPKQSQYHIFICEHEPIKLPAMNGWRWDVSRSNRNWFHEKVTPSDWHDIFSIRLRPGQIKEFRGFGVLIGDVVAGWDWQLITKGILK